MLMTVPTTVANTGNGWDRSDKLAAAALVVSVILPFVLFRLERRQRNKDVAAARAERERERRNVEVEVRLVMQRHAGSSRADMWFRLTLLGGTAQSFVDIIRFVCTVNDREVILVDDKHPRRLSAGQTQHLHAPGPGEVVVQWKVDGETRGRHYSLVPEPWT